jgi:hypothetical protein
MTKILSRIILHGAWAAAAASLVLAGGLLLSGCRSAGTGSGERAAPSEVEGAEYTCPMHPEVVSNTPGKCPKCGMNLEKKMPGGMHEGHETE